MPTTADQARAIHQVARVGIMRDDFEDLALEWMKNFVDAEVLSVWGIPDTSANPLATSSVQLTTPGLYSTRPRWRHPNAERNDGLIGPEGQLDKSGYNTGMKDIQYMTVGVGNWFARMGVSSKGRLTVRSVAPQNVYVHCPDDDPTHPDELWELRLRWWKEQQKWVYAWDVFSIVEGKEPSYHVLSADIGDDGKPVDLSHVFIVHPGSDKKTGAMVGATYPWVRQDKSPRLPYIIYRSANGHEFWNTFEKRGLHRGTLTSVNNATYTGHAARSATGTMALIAGLTPTSVDILDHQGNIATSVTRAIRTIKQTPGCLLYHDLQEGVTPFVKELGAGVNLDSLSGYAERFDRRLALRSGLGASDAEKQNANPTSGAALTITNAQKREFSDQVRPLFRESDLDAVELAAIVLRAAGVANYDETGYTITYHEIPLSPTEEQAKRDALQAEVDEGVISEAERFQRLNPGTSEEDAESALVDAAVSNARVKKRIEEALRAAGLVPAMVPDVMPPTQPPPAGNSAED